MNCTALRRRLLAAERPDRADADAARHLTDCAACRAWRDRLLRVERQLPQLPVPAADAARLAFRERFLGAAPPSEPPLVRATLPGPTPPRERGLRKLAVAMALAAALLLLAVGFALWPHNQPADAPAGNDAELAARQQKRDQRLAAARTPRQRVEVLADIADELRSEALAVAPADRPRKLRALTRFYREVVGDNLPAYAGKLSGQERAAVIEDVARRLLEANSQLEQAGGGDDALHELAVAARDGHDRLRALLRT